MKEKIGRYLNVRQEESMHVTYLLFHYFFQGIGLALLSTVANALFVSHFLEYLPQVFIISSVILLLVGKVNDFFGERWSMPRTLRAMSLFCAVVVLIYYGSAKIFPDFIWMPFILYICFKIVGSQIDLEFWGLASVLFDVRQAKRLFGLITAGDVPAKLIGYLSVAVLVPWIGLLNLLIISSASFLAGSLLLHRLLLKLQPHHFAHHEAETHHGKSNDQNILIRFFHSDFVFVLAILYFVGSVTLTFTDFSFLTEVEHKMEHETQLAFFFGFVFSIGNGIILLFKLFLSARAIERLGIRRSLLSLPVFLLLICIAIYFTGKFAPDESPLMWLFTAMVIFGEVFKAVLYEPIFLALFQPLTTHIRHHAHNVMNGFVSPLGLGLSGLALYSGIQLYHSINLFKINYVLLVLVIIWIVLIFFTVRKYMSTLQTAIHKRLIHSRQLNMGDARSLEILKSRLASNRPDEVIYTADMLQKTHPVVFQNTIPKLIENETSEVRLYALTKINELQLNTDSNILYNLIETDPSEAVRETAIKIYCSQFEDIVDRVTPMLDFPEMRIRSAAIRGFLKSGDLEAMIIGGQKLLTLLSSEKREDIREAIDIIGDLGFRNYYKPLLELLNHKDIEVRKVAILACGKIANPKLIIHLIPSLADRSLKKVTLEALSHIGNPVFEYLKSPEWGERYTEEAIRLCARIGGEEASEILFTDYFPYAKAEILDEVLKALNRIPFNLNKYRKEIEQRFSEELDFAHGCMSMYAFVNAGKTGPLLLHALLEEIRNSKNRVFHFLSLLHERSVIEKARNAAFSAHQEEKANALEFLENLLDRDLKNSLLPLVEWSESALNATRHHEVSLSRVEQWVHEILGRNSRYHKWTQAVVLYEFHDSIEPEILKQYSESTTLLLSQCAGKTGDGKVIKNNKKMSHAHHHEHAEHENMLEIEKVLILKSTGMFASTPENILAGIAGIAREERRLHGEDIFKKGDFGNCLYIICEGDISIHLDGRQLSVLQSREIFGELALLDPEPRSASATAQSDCMLLRIDQSAFSELIEDRPEVAQGIFSLLSKRIRNQNMVIRQLQKKAEENEYRT